jgi:hypothetical protein
VLDLYVCDNHNHKNSGPLEYNTIRRVVSGVLKKCNAVIFRAEEVLLKKKKKKKALCCLEVSEATNPVTHHHIPEET